MSERTSEEIKPSEETEPKPSGVTRARAKPTLEMVGNHQVVSTGKWNHACVAEYVREHGRDRWIPIGDLARTAFMQNTPNGKKRARRCLSPLARYFLERGELLVISYELTGYHRAQAVKLFGPESGELERSSIEQRLTRLHQRSEITQDSYNRMLALLQKQAA